MSADWTGLLPASPWSLVLLVFWSVWVLPSSKLLVLALRAQGQPGTYLKTPSPLPVTSPLVVNWCSASHPSGSLSQHQWRPLFFCVLGTPSLVLQRRPLLLQIWDCQNLEQEANLLDLVL